MKKKRETEEKKDSEDSEEEEEPDKEPEEDEHKPEQFDDLGFFQQMASADFTAPVLEKVAGSSQQITGLDDILSFFTTEKERTAEDEFKYSAAADYQQAETPEETEPRSIVLTPIETAPINRVRDAFREFRGIDLMNNQELQNLGIRDEEEKYLHSEMVERDNRLPFQRVSERKYREFKRR